MAQDMANTAEQQLHLLEQARVHASSATVLDDSFHRQSLMVSRRERKVPGWIWAASGSAGTVILFLLWQWGAGGGEQVSDSRIEKSTSLRENMDSVSSLRRDSIGISRQMATLTEEERRRMDRAIAEKGNKATSEAKVPRLVVSPPSDPTFEEKEKMNFETLLKKAMDASGKTSLEQRTLESIKYNRSKENVCQKLKGLKVSANEAVKEFVRYCEGKYDCYSITPPNSQSQPPEPTPEKKNPNPLTKDQKTLMSKVAHKSFYVQVASYQMTKDAQKRKADLQRLDFRNLIIYPDYSSPSRKRILIPFPSKAEAQKALPEIERIVQGKCIIFELEDNRQ